MQTLLYRLELLRLGALPPSSEAVRAVADASVWFDRARSLLGLGVMVAIAWSLSSRRRQVRWRLVGVGILLQIAVGTFALSSAGQSLFGIFNDVVNGVIGYTGEGSGFLFGRLAEQNNVPVGVSVVPEPGLEGEAGLGAGAGARDAWTQIAKMAPVRAESSGPTRWASIGAYFAFGVLPTIIFFSALMGVFYHLGVMQRVIHLLAIAMQKTLGTSGAETLSAAGNIFVGQTEAPLLVRPYIKEMTESELMAVMTGGFATVAGGVMIAYVGMLRSVIPDIAGHLLSASVMSAPASLVVAKIMMPEPDPTKCKTFGRVNLRVARPHANLIDAAAHGASDGLQLALNVGAMLLAFISLVALANGLLGWASGLVALAEPLTLERLLGAVLSPLAWCMGVPWDDAARVGSLLGVKTVLNEFVAYEMLSREAASMVHERSSLIAAYALCGFANFGSIGIQIGGLSPLAPERRQDFARIGVRAMIGGTLAAFMTACVVGMMT
ncbi:MAG: NupC/NupG family nucleoside CNT transporter [Deltaproteobacteria bacterium]|nr:NupC/NupG family nucleoside CNT transporter [Deltaproteobacteria bacterium]